MLEFVREEKKLLEELETMNITIQRTRQLGRGNLPERPQTWGAAPVSGSAQT